MNERAILETVDGLGAKGVMSYLIGSLIVSRPSTLVPDPSAALGRPRGERAIFFSE